MYIKEIHNKLISGIGSFFNNKPKKAVLGLSGGLDSALVLALVAEAFGNEGDIDVILMPSMYSSKHSVDDALQLANNLGVKHSIINIEPIYNSFKNSLQPVFEGQAEDVTEENLQARIRGTLLMAYSNRNGHFVLNTSNKSELSVGYGTLYGDLAGAICVLGDVYKTQAYEICKYINRHKEIIPVNTITKPPSAELRPDQKDSDSLPSYDVLDPILQLIVEQHKTREEILALGFECAIIYRIFELINKSGFKLLQIPPIIKITDNPLLPNWKLI